MCFRPPTTQKMEKVCPVCNTVNDLMAEKCSQCGTELPSQPPPPGQSGGAPHPPGKSGGVTPPKAPPAPPKAPPLPPQKK